MSGPDSLPGNGGCLCGAVRYELRAPPALAGYCHCSLCRHASGAPVLVFATVARVDFAFVRGQPRCFPSTSFGRRWFCADCGTQLCMQVDHEPDTTDVTVASMDDADPVSPTFHIWYASRLAWFDTADTLHRYPHARTSNAGE
ncbi:GFA family protein [Agrilutibacter solisilvae]|uniref:GFA family protein n=1 Tax=Agrilutibacter solisilvae TaxID=2763317 RepID=A0A974XZM2_9GAMM|nr:GFA family protein [Lysobacter solisilvae]QSX77853.1 GFA family protein [Lysobacter solisilvae]